MPRFAPDPSVSFRTARQSDALCLGVLGLQIFLDTYATEGIRATLAREALSQFSAEAIGALLQRPGTCFTVAERDGHLIGYAQLTFGATQALVQAPEDAAQAELDKLYVQRPFLGRGLGRALLEEAEALSAEQGAHVMWLTAWSGNDRARRFYARQGYRDLGAAMHVFEHEAHENRVFAKVLGLQ